MSAKQYLRSPKTKVALITLAHGVNDMYAAFLPTFMPFIKANLGLSYALAGSFNFIVGIFHIICQPIFGYLSDRIRRPLPIIIGPILCGIGAVMVPNMNSYHAALFFAALWGFGSALFHPQGTGGIGYVSSPEQLRRSMTWFSVAGAAGSAISPFIAVAIVAVMGYRWLPVAVIPTLILAPLIYFSMPFLRSETIPDNNRRGFFETILFLLALLYPIFGIAVIRDMLFMSIRFLLPIKIAAQGGNLGSIGMVMFCITLGCCVGMVFMGKIAARYGSKMAILGSMLASSGFLLMAALSTGFFSIVLYVLGLTCVYSTVPLTATMAQKLAPDERSMASTIVLGFAWGIGNLMVAPVGKIADLFGINAAFILLALIPLLGLPLLLAPPLKMLKE